MRSGVKAIQGCYVVTVVILCGLFCSPTAQGLPSDRPCWPIMILHGADILLRASIVVDQAIRDAFLAGANREIEFLSEDLDALRLPGAGFETAFVEYLRKKYDGRTPDIVIAVYAAALELARQHRPELWPDAPLVFCCVPDDLIRRRYLGARTTGVCLTYDLAGTLDLAIRLQPAARRVVLIAGASDFDRAWIPQSEQVFARYRQQGRLETVYLTNQSLPQLIEAVRVLPLDSMVLYTSVFRDTTGRTFVPVDVLKQLAQASRAPIYSAADTYIGNGIVGGSISKLRTQGEHAARLALRVLAGEKPETIPVEPSPSAELVIDWRELRRWNMGENLLPPGSDVIFRQASFWDRYRRYIVAIGAAIAGQR